MLERYYKIEKPSLTIGDTMFVGAIGESYANAISAAVLAGSIHDATNQKYDTYPYSKHITDVAAVAAKYVLLIDKEVVHSDMVTPILFAAAFHDSIEDARLTYNDVVKYARKFGMDDNDATAAAEIVYAVTNEKGRTRSERADERYYDGIKRTRGASFVKMCDRLANVRYSTSIKSPMAEKYMREMETFISHMNMSEVPVELIKELDNLITNYKDQIELI